jgi:hypothetical protein
MGGGNVVEAWYIGFLMGLPILLVGLLWQMTKQLAAINNNVCRLIDLVDDPKKAKEKWAFETKQWMADQDFWWRWFWRPLGLAVLAVILFGALMLLQAFGLFPTKNVLH